MIWCRAAVTLSRCCVLRAVPKEGVSEKRKLVQSTAPIKQHPKNHRGKLYQSSIPAFSPCSCWASPAHRGNKCNWADADICVVARNAQNATSLGVIQHRYPSEDTAGKLTVELECFCEKTQTLVDFLFYNF